MRKILFPVIILLGIKLLTDYVPRTLDSGSENVSVVPNNNYEVEILKSCKYLGQLSGKNIHGESPYFASTDSLEQDDMNFLRNEAKKSGANVVFRQHQAVSTPHNSATPKKHYYTEVAHNIQGKAYVCPINVKNELWRWTIKNHYSY